MTLLNLNTGTSIIDIQAGTVTTSGTAQALTSTATPCKGVVIQNNDTAAEIHFGTSTVDATSDPPVNMGKLFPTQRSEVIRTNDAALIFVDSSADDADFSYSVLG